MTLEEQFDRDEYVISLLNEIKDKIDLEQKGRAMLLSQIADLYTKLDYIIDILTPLNYFTHPDELIRQRERAW